MRVYLMVVMAVLLVVSQVQAKGCKNVILREVCDTAACRTCLQGLSGSEKRAMKACRETFKKCADTAATCRTSLTTCYGNVSGYSGCSAL